MLKQEDIDTLRNKRISAQNLFVGSKQIPSKSGKTLEVTSPIDGETLTTIANKAPKATASKVEST